MKLKVTEITESKDICTYFYLTKNLGSTEQITKTCNQIKNKLDLIAGFSYTKYAEGHCFFLMEAYRGSLTNQQVQQAIESVNI